MPRTLRIQHVVLLAGLFAVLAVAAVLRLTNTNLAQAQTPLLQAIAVDADPGVDPSAAVWATAPVVEVPLTAQNIVYPNGGGTVPLITAQAVHYNETLSIRLQWSDDQPDQSSVATEAFSDAAALMFPAQSTTAVPAITMGQADAGVNIWYWRADSQIGVPDRPDAIYAGTLVDDYPFVDDPEFYPARAVGNPVAGNAAGPVQNLTARGFGTLAPASDQNAAGSGSYADGQWSVVIARGFAAPDLDQADFGIGSTTDIAFAVWDGDNGDRNGQKSISQFLRLEIAGADEAPESPPTEEVPAIAISDDDDDGRDLAALLAFAIGAPVLLILLMGWMYLVYGRRKV